MRAVYWNTYLLYSRIANFCRILDAIIFIFNKILEFWCLYLIHPDTHTFLPVNIHNIQNKTSIFKAWLILKHKKDTDHSLVGMYIVLINESTSSVQLIMNYFRILLILLIFFCVIIFICDKNISIRMISLFITLFFHFCYRLSYVAVSVSNRWRNASRRRFFLDQIVWTLLLTTVNN